MKNNEDIKYIARNRKAKYNYEIHSSFEAGIELLGTEVKSIREGKVTLSDSYAVVEKGQVFLRNLHISAYKMASDENHDPLRVRRLLLHKREIRKLQSQIDQKGMTLIPLGIYFKKKVAKIELALVVGRKKYDKRQAIAKAEADRKIKNATKKNY
ncbi:MAG: SsrA-binding protein SmpB [Candidatus Zixiibacteriota bacterium]